MARVQLVGRIALSEGACGGVEAGSRQACHNSDYGCCYQVSPGYQLQGPCHYQVQDQARGHGQQRWSQDDLDSVSYI
jgi:hypothetical protein